MKIIITLQQLPRHDGKESTGKDKTHREKCSIVNLSYREYKQVHTLNLFIFAF